MVHKTPKSVGGYACDGSGCKLVTGSETQASCLDACPKFRGTNLSAYDMGCMAGIADQQGLCTDDSRSTGGWINYTSIENKDESAVDVASPYTVGNAGSVGYDLTNALNGSPLQPVRNTNHLVDPVQNSTWATSYPQPNQIDKAVAQGVNIFRVPFMPTFMKSLATWMGCSRTKGWTRFFVCSR